MCYREINDCKCIEKGSIVVIDPYSGTRDGVKQFSEMEGINVYELNNEIAFPEKPFCREDVGKIYSKKPLAVIINTNILTCDTEDICGHLLDMFRWKPYILVCVGNKKCPRNEDKECDKKNRGYIISDEEISKLPGMLKRLKPSFSSRTCYLINKFMNEVFKHIEIQRVDCTKLFYVFIVLSTIVFVGGLFQGLREMGILEKEKIKEIKEIIILPGTQKIKDNNLEN
ncbi:MAG: hypothetical protein HQL07_12145 [Nitrospirae bacterium]|nr:hypothetical protein [Magnetococcales bacterium]HAT51051.1 hypothetical protein [Alphaproteobacteria bacterium]